MLKTIMAAVCRAAIWVANKTVEIALVPVHAVIMQLFPAAYEPLPDLADHEVAVKCDLLPFDPFEHAEETAAARETEANLVMAWAAETVLSGAELDLPDAKPGVRAWLASLSIEELDRIVQAGKQAVYGHLHFDMTIEGVPEVSGRGSRPETNSWDPCFSVGGFAAVAQRAS
ncbi:hypothetical protein [Bradyrhizobium liaoningense]|uniref:hypothetical protein n=1 Tax=Bradyrhizobium liaoningense TaxID=43992 RepID=UPI001BA64F0B|nr:hypothetical protein [Bradyrhizobium liaoningense]MBR0822414.1 hypothetical protein [Bradyrhizobium liaoningense]